MPGENIPGVLHIDGVPRDYDWGSRSAIEDMLGIPRDGNPIAELWFGAHPDDPARAPRLGAALDALIADDPEAWLGQATAQRFGGRLPFLLKVLAAERPLSIQVHPTLEQARAGFAAENAAGVDSGVRERSYRDANHKPELVCALTQFEALCGFRPVRDAKDVLARFALAALAPLAELLDGADPHRSAFVHLLTLADPRALAREVAERARALIEVNPADGAARAVLLADEHFSGDVGVVLSLLLNYVVLQPGEAIFLGAGNVHAYLRGVGIEIMANSDNVLRCGLTPKHIDVAEVLAVADFGPLEDPRWRPEVPGRFRPPVDDFALSRIDLAALAKPGQSRGSYSGGPVGLPCIVLCTSGSASVSLGSDSVTLRPGHAAFVPAHDSSLVVEGDGVVFAATPGLSPEVAPPPA
jgi:mannose-6-phosphate isomerase